MWDAENSRPLVPLRDRKTDSLLAECRLSQYGHREREIGEAIANTNGLFFA